MKAKFIRESINIQRPKARRNIDVDYNNVRSLGSQDSEKITITIEFIGFGDTTKLKTEELLRKVMFKIGDEL